MPVPRAVVDLLNSLLEAEQESLFRFMTEGSPYLGRAGPDVRKTLAYVAAADHRRAGELWRLIEQLGGEPRPRRLQPAEAMLAYLSLQFLLPKLIEAKELLLERYRNAAAAMKTMAPPEQAAGLVRKHLSEHATELEMLRQTRIA
jgi:hypothetical protein